MYAVCNIRINIDLPNIKIQRKIKIVKIYLYYYYLCNNYKFKCYKY